jgi:hypothetical protein
MTTFYLATDGHHEPTIFTDLPDAEATPVIRRVDLPDDVRHLWDELARLVTCCGHQHAGPELGGICIGCACGVTG